jgi:PKD repeat protein
MTNNSDTFQIIFIDLRVGQLGLNSGIPGLINTGDSKVEYSIENLHSQLSFDSYLFDSNSKQGMNVIAWTNRLAGGSLISGYTVLGSPSPVPVALPGQTNPPTDPRHENLYGDLNVNGRIDFNDLQLFFKYMTWIQANEPISLFDYNHNGRIDFNDLQLLFREM